MYSRVYTLSLLIIILAGVSSCKKTPTFAPENALDPFSKEFSPEKPLDFNVTIDKSDQETSYISLSWRQSREQLNGISGFKIFKSFSDSLSAILIADLESNKETSSYSFEDSYEEDAFKHLYSVQSYFIQGKDTVFSEPVLNEILNTPTYTISCEIHPFKKYPYISCDWDFDTSQNLEIEFYIEAKSDEEKILIGSSETNNSSSLQLKFDKNILFDKVLFKLRNDNYSSDCIEINSIELKKFIPSFDITEITNNSEENFDINVSASDSSGEDELAFDVLEIQVKTTSLIDSSIKEEVFTINNPSKLETISINNAQLKSYEFTIQGFNGVFESQSSSSDVRFQKDVVSTTLHELRVPGYYYFKTYFNSDDSNILLSAYDMRTRLFDFASERSFDVFESNSFGTIRQAKFFKTQSDENEFILHSNHHGSLTKFKIENSVLSEVDTYPPLFGDHHVLDFEIIPNNKLLMISASENGSDAFVFSQLRLSVFDLTDKTHTPLGSYKSVKYRSTRVVYNEYRNQAYMIYANGDLEIIMDVFDISESIELARTINLGYLKSLTGVNLVNSGKHLLLFNEQKYLKLNVESLKLSSSYPFPNPGNSSIRNIHGSTNSTDVCKSARVSETGLPNNYTYVNCTDDLKEENIYFSYKSNKAIRSSFSNSDGSKLILLFNFDFEIFEFVKKWTVINDISLPWNTVIVSSYLNH